MSSSQMAASTAAGSGASATWFGQTTEFYKAISAAHPELVQTNLLLAAGKKTGEAYDFIFSPGGMVSNILVGDLKTNMEGVVNYDTATGGSVQFFQDLCKREVEEKGLAKVRGTKASGTVSGLWFLRHLLFVTRFLEILFSNDTVTPAAAAKQTYDEVLKPYHGFMLSGVVGAAMALAPARETLYTNLGGNADTIKAEAASFLAAAKPVVARVKAFYDAQGWYFPDKA